MHTDLFYHKNSCTAFAVLPSCDKKESLLLEIELLENHFDIEPIIVFEHKKIGEGRYWGHSILKFRLHPDALLGNTDYIELTAENAKDLAPEPMKIYEKKWW